MYAIDCPVGTIYCVAPFKVNRAYAEHFSEHWLILSAKYGFVSPDFLIPGPYNVTFKKRSTQPVSLPVLRDQIKVQGLHDFDVIIGLGGIDYRTTIEHAFAGYCVKLSFPFAGIPLGLAMQAVRRAIDSNDFRIEGNSIRHDGGAKDTVVKRHADDSF